MTWRWERNIEGKESVRRDVKKDMEEVLPRIGVLWRSGEPSGRCLRREVLRVGSPRRQAPGKVRPGQARPGQASAWSSAAGSQASAAAAAAATAVAGQQQEEGPDGRAAHRRVVGCDRRRDAAHSIGRHDHLGVDLLHAFKQRLQVLGKCLRVEWAGDRARGAGVGGKGRGTGPGGLVWVEKAGG